jgi:antibiotic biosynthesis monooxygenase (ABM) superfamily enzyme
MSDTMHIAITRRVRKEHAREFEAALAEFASRSLAGAGSRGVQLLYPPPGSDTCEYGILRSFASAADRDAFYDSALFKEWLARIEPMIEGAPTYRELSGLEAWFREPHAAMPPRWKMALLTWIAVWPVSMAVPAMLAPLLGPGVPAVISAGLVAAGIVVVLTWAAMPLLVKATRPWLHPAPPGLSSATPL